MGNSGFKMNGDWEKQLNAAIKGGVDKLARDHTSMIDSLIRRYRGRPVEDIKPVLQREWRQLNGGSITDPELTECAQAISDGIKVTFRNGGLQK